MTLDYKKTFSQQLLKLLVLKEPNKTKHPNVLIWIIEFKNPEYTYWDENSVVDHNNVL